MKKIFNKILNNLGNDTLEPTKSRKEENNEIIEIFNRIREVVPSHNEPNYMLAEKVFREFNDFNLNNIKEIHSAYLKYIPKSLLPYPKNYIKCAYYIFLKLAEKNNDLKLLKLIQEIGADLFCNYPDYAKYKINLETKKLWDDAFKEKGLNPKESFKKLYGAYVVSEEDYLSSPSSIDSHELELIYDFGFLPEMEEDEVFVERMKKMMNL